MTIAIALGGIGDLMIGRLLDVHTRYLQAGAGMAVPPRTSALVIHLLHALGGSLVGVGIASFALVHLAVRRGQRVAAVVVLIAVAASEGANAIGMYAVGSFWYVPVAYLVLTMAGVTLTFAAPSNRQPNGRAAGA